MIINRKVIGGSSSYIVVTSLAGALLTCDSQTYQLGASETTHSFGVNLGSHTVTASKNGRTQTQSVVVDVAWAYTITMSLPRLPNAYQEVEYLESTGSQYIIPNYVPNPTTKFVYEYSFTQIHNHEAIAGVGRSAHQSWYVDLSRIYSESPPKELSRFYYADNNAGNQLAALTNTKRKIIFNDGGYMFVNDIESYQCQNRVADINPEKTMLIFANCDYNEDDTTLIDNIHYSHAKIYYFKIYDQQTTLVRDFVPCYRKSDSVAGMYDLVNDVFYTNQGTGDDFIAGNGGAS